MRTRLNSFAVILLIAVSLPVDAGRLMINMGNEYDEYFQIYTRRYFGPNFDWRWFKAQAVIESNLNPDAKSHAGAIGIMQILPSTFEEIRETNPHYADITDPKWNIAAGIYYNRYLYRQKNWHGLADFDKLCLTFAGYNAGLGGTLRAVKRAPAPATRWEQIRPHVPDETRNYVDRIQRLRAEL